MDSPDLTRRQRQVAELVAQRLTAKRIAGRLGISHRRVQTIERELAAIAGVQPDEDSRIAIADWWRASHPEQHGQQDAA